MLIDQIRAYNPKTNAKLIADAWDYSREMHQTQTRQSGEPYFIHPVAVAHILVGMRLDDATIATALLHDTIEDTKGTFGEIEARFGVEVAEMVDGVTKLTNLQPTSSEAKQAENFRKLFIAMSRDIRVIMVKLADRLHNMRTIGHMRREKQIKKSHETMDIFAPLAGRMGMQWMRDELEDLAFQVLNPEVRLSIERRLETLQRETGDLMPQITADIEQEIALAGLSAEVSGRLKRPFSIWRKMQEKKLYFSRMSDIIGFRILCQNEVDCYTALGAMHRRWSAVPGRFKDYISQPKSNGYRSIHTTVSGRDGKRVEIQIRTHRMHEAAETGIAAHWSYRNGERVENPYAVAPAAWVAQLTESFEISDNHGEFLETVKLEMYNDKVFCFTPKGQVIQLPSGATPLDFAYAVHTRIGDACVGAKVDAIRVPLWTRLKNGQSVEIITAEGQRPQPSWEEIAQTGRAKNAIRRALREENRQRYIKLGLELSRVAFNHVGKRMTEKALSIAARHHGLPNSDELLALIGEARMTASSVVETIYPNLSLSETPEISGRDAVVGLHPGQAFEVAKCCQPIPQERMIGVSYPGKGLILHAIDCPVVAEIDEDRWLDLRWHSGTHAAVHTVSLELTIANDAGVLGRICTLIGEQKANISDLRFLDRKQDFYRLIMDVDIRDAKHFHAVQLALEADNDVATVTRHRDVSRKPNEAGNQG